MSFRSLCRQSIGLESNTGKNYSGDPTYSDPVTLRARVEGTSKRILTGNNEEKPATALVIVEEIVKTGDRITLDTGEARIVLRSDITPDGSGKHHHSEAYI